ncbi:SidA/IucD/PvdA family monooxygenase [Micromonospora terminaliae]|uniref:FAD-dependent oxidoreductase n=1 Tax=Micromonospora terminaliae TaxID=1914461 RepID=A0AAJ2ZHZ7_9ACTN|nr:FAD/NAD(P)-binding protein [Micromonospora terminaliae]NES30253.1 FAD-dependent oxidoreductase [Micromonospora terminaliae]QGL46985.1 SidA/IucD/PvdA family monooxygenase [Micromonospora terminaliae]
MRRPRILVIGAGLAGTATALRLLQFARMPLEIVLLERRAEYRYAGVAYHRDGNPWGHVFNIQAGRMSAFREDVDDFVHWANNEADRRQWPEPWTDFEFVEHGPAPRRIYHDYLADRMTEARREAYPDVDLVEAEGEAIDLTVSDHHVEVTIRDANGTDAERTSTLITDHVVLATGLEPKWPAFAVDVLAHEAFIQHPYSTEGVHRLLTVPPQANVVIVGTVLSAYDSAALLLRQGHTGTIHLVSRSGTTPRAYPEHHQHGVVQLPVPARLLEPYRNRDDFLARLRTEWEAACATVRADHPEIDPMVVSERVAKAWEPHLPMIIDRIPTDELRRLLDDYSTRIAAFRVGAVRYTTAIVEQVMAAENGPVEIVIGRVERVEPAGSERLAVTVAAPTTTRVITADLVVCNFGRETDYTQVDSPLWKNLLAKDLVTPHRRTGRGIEVDDRGTPLRPDGEPVTLLSAIGVMREGDEIVRNGRAGAFAFNLAAIKNHSIVVAAHLLARLELDSDDAARRAVAERRRALAADASTRPELEEAVSLEVRRLATRSRDERRRLDERLEAHLLSMDSRRASRPDGTHGRLTRAAVNQAAVERLTDISVTPRQLRRRLRIVTDEDAEIS